MELTILKEKGKKAQESQSDSIIVPPNTKLLINMGPNKTAVVFE